MDADDVSDGRRHGSPLAPPASTWSMAATEAKPGWLRGPGIEVSIKVYVTGWWWMGKETMGSVDPERADSSETGVHCKGPEVPAWRCRALVRMCMCMWLP